VQVDVAAEPRLDGVQLSALMVVGAVNAMLAVCVLPFSVAVTVAV
jgi:hypothetical protein